MKKSILVFAATFFLTRAFTQGCTVSALASTDTIVCGDAVTLSAYGQGQGIALLSENFNNSTFGPGWSASPQATWSNPCSPGGVNGTTHIWLGDQSPVPRALTTASFNLSSCTNAGVTICFDMLFAEQGDASPCEGPDEPDEGVYLQYSTNNGTTWTDINYFDPNGGNDPMLVNWNNWCFPVPLAALTANTRFRWFQDNDSGAEYDHWGIDNVVIYCNDPTYNIVWNHDGYNHGPVGGVNPTPVSPTTTTTYTVVMSNGTVSCTNSVQIVVRNPTVIVNAGNDTTICTGQCAVLNGSARVIKSPAKVVTYSNNELTSITTGLGQVTNIGINVTGLNMPTVLPNSITQVCISNVFFFGTNLFPPSQVDISDLILSLTCPSGQTITLVPANVTTGGSNPLTGGYNNTCFVPAGSNIASGSPPYTGSYAPNQPFNNLSGCTSNGVWELNVEMNTALGFGTGTFSGWRITFDDPEISYPADIVWSPTSNMTNSGTLSPTVCPPANGSYTYTLSASDTAGCVTQSDAVNVTVQSCCSIGASVAVVQPTCAQSNGSINLTPSPAAAYTFVWSDGNTSQNRTGLAAGSYSVTMTNPGQANCTWDTTIVLNSNSTLNLQLTSTNPTCAGNDGTITVSLSGGTAPYTVTIDTNGASQTINLPFAIPPQTIPGIAAGTASVSVVDLQGCVANVSTTLTAPANCCTFTVSANLVQPACSQTNGSITLTPANGSGTYNYSWAGGLGANNSVSSLGAGNYSVTITDPAFANCFIDTSFALSNPNAPVINNIAATDETCLGDADGTVTVTASGGTGQLTILWSNAATTFSISALAGGNYDFTVTDANGCQATGSATVNPGANCCALTLSASVTGIGCSGATTGGIDVTASGATGAVTYLWSDGITTEDRTSLLAGIYTVTATDNACTVSASYTVAQGAAISVSIQSQDALCYQAPNGSMSAVVSGGTSPFSYLWTDGQTTVTASSLIAGTYSVTVTDGSGCTATASATINEPSEVIINATTTAVTCPGADDGTISVTATGGNAPYTYSATQDFANFYYTTNGVIIGLRPGVYSVIVSDFNGCTDVLLVTVPDATPDIFTTATDSTSCFGIQYADGSASIDALSAQNGPYQYSIDGGPLQTGGDFFNLSAGNHTITAINGFGCDTQIVVTIYEPAPITVQVNPDTLTLDLGGSGQVIATYQNASNVTYNWSPSSVFSCNDCADPFVSTTQDGEFTVTVQQNTGTSVCEASASFVVVVKPHKPVFIPNSFTPNGDGNNDFFFIYGEAIKYFDLKIFNRWGEKVYESNSILQGWDGTYRGKEQEPQVFIYYVDIVFLDDQTESKKGGLTLIR